MSYPCPEAYALTRFRVRLVPPVIMQTFPTTFPTTYTSTSLKLRSYSTCARTSIKYRQTSNQIRQSIFYDVRITNNEDIRSDM